MFMLRRETVRFCRERGTQDASVTFPFVPVRCEDIVSVLPVEMHSVVNCRQRWATYKTAWVASSSLRNAFFVSRTARLVSNDDV